MSSEPLLEQPKEKPLLEEPKEKKEHRFRKTVIWIRQTSPILGVVLVLCNLFSILNLELSSQAIVAFFFKIYLM